MIVEYDFGTVLDDANGLVASDSGGTITLSNRAALTIPAETLDTNVQVRLIRSELPAALRDQDILSDIYYLSSDSRPSVAGSVSLSIPYEPEDLPPGVSEDSLQAYAIEGQGAFTYPVASHVETDARVVVIENPQVAVNLIPGYPYRSITTGIVASTAPRPMGRSAAGEEADWQATGYGLGFKRPEAPTSCSSGAPGEVHEEPGHAFRLLVRSQTSCDFARYVSGALQDAYATYNQDYPNTEGKPPFRHLGPSDRMAVYLGDYGGVNGEYKPWSWKGWIQVDVSAGERDRVGLRETIFHEMFHAVQDMYSNMYLAGNLAMWWYEATAEWAGLAAREQPFEASVALEMDLYPELLSVPIQESYAYRGGLESYGYSLLIDHVERQSPGHVLKVLNSWKTTSGSLYAALAAAGRLTETYPAFVREVMAANLAVRENFWTAARLFEEDGSTRLFRRPTTRIGDVAQDVTILDAAEDRDAEHSFTLKLAPVTTQFVLIQTRDRLASPRTVKVKLKESTTPSDSAWLATLPYAAASPTTPETARLPLDGASVTAFGRTHRSLWIGVFNADAEETRSFTLTVKIEQQQEPFQGTLLIERFNDRFPPRALTVDGATLRPDAAIVEAFLTSGRYDDTFGFFQLDCTVSVYSYEASGTFDPATGVIQGSYALSYDYTGANESRCRQMQADLTGNVGILLKRVPAFQGGVVEFQGTVDSRGWGTVQVTFPDGTTGELDVRPYVN